MQYKSDDLDQWIDRGRAINAVTEQLKNVKKDSKNDEVRALAAAFLSFVEAVRPVVLFKSS